MAQRKFKKTLIMCQVSYQVAGKSVGYSSPSSVALVYLLNSSFLLEMAV